MLILFESPQQHCPMKLLFKSGIPPPTVEFIDSEFKRRYDSMMRIALGLHTLLMGSRLVQAVEKICSTSRLEFCGSGKAARIVAAKEAFIVAGRRLGASMRTLSEISGLNSSNISRRHAIALTRMRQNDTLREMTTKIIEEYQTNP